CGLALAGIPAVTAMGLASAVVVAVMVLASITLLPALLGFAGLRLLHASLPWSRRVDPAAPVALDARPARRSGWQRWGDHVTRHPWPWLAAGTLALLLAAAPALSMRLGQTDAGTDPPGTTTRAAYDLTAEAFGAGYNGPLLVAAELDGGDGDAAALQALAEAVAADPAVELAYPPQLSEGGDAALLMVVPTGAPQDEETSDLVHRLRDEVVPGALEGTDVEAHVGGQTAVFIDLADKVAGRLPVFIAAVVGLSFLLLTAVFRSIAVPLKAAVLNVLSIGAAYGVVVAVFQW